MIRVSDLSGREVILRKLLSFLILSIFAATILALELIFYKYYVQHVNFPLWVYVRQIYVYFLAYGTFVYMVSRTPTERPLRIRLRTGKLPRIGLVPGGYSLRRQPLDAICANSWPFSGG